MSSGGYFDFARKEQEIFQLKNISQEPAFWQNQKEASLTLQRLSNLEKELASWQELQKQITDLPQLITVTESDDNQTELLTMMEQLEKRISQWELLSLLSGKYDQSSVIMNIYAGAGGTEAQDWAGMLLRMYLRFAEIKNWSVNIIDSSLGAEIGYKSVTLEIVGDYAYGYLQGEGGVHRLVRLSPFDADHARHTSFAMVQIMPELANADAQVVINDEEIRIDTYRASGKGGQKVNKTESAVRVVHLPTSITVTCQNERSQQQNKETALRILRSKLQVLAESQKEEEKKLIRGELTTAAWGNQIRSYVLHPYKMVKDHRTNLESTEPQKLLDGELNDYISSYLRYKRIKENEK